MWVKDVWYDDCKMYDDFPMEDGGDRESDWMDDEWLEALWEEDDRLFSKVQ